MISSVAFLIPKPLAPIEPPALMSTKGEAFAGLSVAITTPFKDGAVRSCRAARHRSNFKSPRARIASARSARRANRRRFRTKSTSG